MKKLLDRHPYGCAICINVLAVVTIAVFRGIVFETVDDYNVMMTLAGEKTGSPYYQVTFFNTIFAFFITRLYLLFGGVQWYTILHLLFIILSLSAIMGTCFEECKSLATTYRVPMLLFALYYVSLYCYPIQRLQFTSTAALCGAASCVLLFSISRKTLSDERKVARTIIAGAVFLALALIERRSAGIASGALCLVAIARLVVVFHVSEMRMGWRHIAQTLGIATAVAGITLAMLFGHIYILDHGDNAGYREYDKWRAAYQDHPQLTYEDDPDLYQSVGWDETDYRLSKSLIYIDEGINAECFERIVEASKAKRDSVGLGKVAELATSIIWDNGYGRVITIVLLCQTVLLAMCLITSMQRERDIVGDVALDAAFGIGLTLASLALTYYVCNTGRWSVRTYESVALPITGCLFLAFMRGEALLSADIRERLHRRGSSGAWKPSFLTFACLVALTSTATMAVGHLEGLRSKDVTSIKRTRSIEAYAISHPDEIIVHDYSVSNTYNSYDPFRVYIDADLHNLIISGGSYTYTGAYYAQLHANGLGKLDGSTLLQDNVYYITDPARGGPYYETVLRYLLAKYGDGTEDSVLIELVDSLDGNAHVYKYRFAPRP